MSNFTRQFKTGLLTLAALFVLAPFAAHADGGPRYQVQKGDQLGAVLSHMGVRTLWGKTGAVGETVKLNPSLAKSDGGLIIPGMWITIPQSALPQQSARYKINENNEISWIAAPRATRAVASVKEAVPTAIQEAAPPVAANDWNVPPPPPVEAPQAKAPSPANEASAPKPLTQDLSLLRNHL